MEKLKFELFDLKMKMVRKKIKTKHPEQINMKNNVTVERFF